jgi:hypothetical protein
MGTLPAVQPLMAPRFAEMREHSRSSAEPGMTAETDTIATARREGNIRRRPLSSRDDEKPGQQESPPLDRSMVEQPEHRTRSDKEAEPQIPHLQQVVPAERQLLTIPDASQFQPQSTRRFASEHLEAETPDPAPPTRSASRNQTTSLLKNSPGLDRLAARREAAKPDATPAENRASATKIALSNDPEPPRQDTIRNPNLGTTGQPEAQPALQIHSRSTPQIERTGVEPAEDQTEVHISIGSIELRAPRSEPRQAAPSRPRVTLDEFLRRGREFRR